MMSNVRGESLFAFLAVTLLWGASAIVTRDQAHTIGAEFSVGIRMLIVSLVMYLVCQATSVSVAIPRREIGWVVCQGVLFFGLSFIFFYHATIHMPSGVAALVLSTSSLVSVIAGRVLLRAPVGAMQIVGIGLGIVGLIIVMAPSLMLIRTGSELWIGMVFATAAAVCTGLGTVVAARNQSKGLNIFAIMVWAALSGAVVAFSVAVFMQSPIMFVPTPRIVAGLLYLALMASCLTFFIYFQLVRKFGPGPASYTLSAVPVVAIMLSAAFERMPLNLWVVGGAATIVVGNVLVVMKPAMVNPE